MSVMTGRACNDGACLKGGGESERRGRVCNEGACLKVGGLVCSALPGLGWSGWKHSHGLG